MDLHLKLRGERHTTSSCRRRTYQRWMQSFAPPQLWPIAACNRNVLMTYNVFGMHASGTRSSRQASHSIQFSWLGVGGWVRDLMGMKVVHISVH